MPAVGHPTDPFQYCDGAAVGGYACPEFDMMEANRYAFRAVGHKCDFTGGKYTNCDQNGTCAVDVLSDLPKGSFGPGSSYIIDTNKPLHMRQDYFASAGQFTGYTTYLSQGDNVLVLPKTGCDYLKNMTEDMKQMVITISSWGSKSLRWL